VLDGYRGNRPWDREQLQQILLSIGRLVDGAAAWMATLDVNPLAVTPTGFVALDCLCILKSELG
jgi:hypothetical protein